MSVLGDGSVSLDTTQGQLTLSLSSLGLRLQSSSKKMSDNFDYGIIISPVKNDATKSIQETPSHFIIATKHDTVKIQKQPFAFEWKRADKLVQKTPNDGHFVRQYRLPPLAKTSEGWLISLDLGPEEAVFGLGEKWSSLNKRGQLIRSYNHDALGVNAEISYKNTPFAWSPEGWGVFVHTPAAVTHSVGHAAWSQRAYSLLVEDEDLDLFLFAGKDGKHIINSYTSLTGKAPVPPLWSLGVILSKAYYKDVPELLATAKDVRQKHMPCDVITLDGRAWQDTDTRFAFEWDPKRYDNPASVINELKAQHFKVCVWEYPLVSVENKLFDKMAKNGWLIKDKRTNEAYRYQWDQSAFAEVLTPLPESGIVDFTHPGAFQFWLESHKPLFDLGVDMIKADFGEQLEDENMLAHNGDSGIRLHNAYSMLYNRCVYQAAEKYCQSGPFLFSRSAWAGSQRYPSQWGGDPQADWGGLIGSIRGALSWGMSGAPYYATDIGGFYKDTRDPILFVRWAQAAVFSAHMRLHGIGQREPWSYGKAAETAVNKAIALRYQLLPYLYECTQQANATGLPVMRAMPIAFPQDRIAHSFEMQFMLGEDILFAPCTNEHNEVDVYFPDGEWLHYPSGKNYKACQHVKLTLALDDMAVFVKSGKHIPLGPIIEHVEALKNNIQPEVESYWPQKP
ncbi:alpha-xylosidase [Aestuariibacter sp. P117]|uniref:Alpha-xylosidase n=1 Tax=Glaciecola petra TaxID=3075602 RepID=A0ABU2ZRA7_9ALTE|nr:alpha-xylosidase [Aestuariibacter sp. P117]MDT0595171.1 alpha-xylosidase [Aestuariibacter sp. P117]